MYAIVKTGGKQYRVERGQKLLVERLEGAEGADVALEPLLYRSDDAVFDKDGLTDVQVTAKILGHVRGEKLRVAKFKPKRGYKRRTGHRQELTQIEVVEISHKGKAARKAPARTKAEDQARDATPAAAAEAPAAKAPAAKEAAPKEAAAKAPAAKAPAAKAAPKPKAAPKAKPAPKAKAAPKAKPAAKPKAKEDKDDGA
jgi:large subunit ribosomal protein L21